MENVFLLILCLTIPYTNAQYDPLFHPNHSTIVTLFEWPFDAVARECEEFLGPNGFGGVQISPVNEHIVLPPDRSWNERYEPISYKICTRSGNESGLLSMTQRCNAAGVRIYVDVVLNHMANYKEGIIGTAGSVVFENRSYPGVPYEDRDFHRPCKINNHMDAHVVRNCYLYGMPDLDQSKETVRQRISEFLNRLIDLGVAGFRIAACKYMWPNDLKSIYSQIKNVSVEHGFPPETRPFIYQEVWDNGVDPIAKTEYTFIGAVTEVVYAWIVGQAFLKNWQLKHFEEIGPSLGFVHSADAVVFLDTPILQRETAPKNQTISFNQVRAIQTAYVFMLAHDFGLPRVMSSYYYGQDDQGPPVRNGSDQICTPFDEGCSDRWVLEHRWPIIVRLIHFRNTIGSESVRHFRSYHSFHIIFCRGRVGFVAFNNSPTLCFDKIVTVCIPAGKYCDLTSIEGGNCSNMIEVSSESMARIVIPVEKAIPAVVLYVGQLDNYEYKLES